MSTLSLEDEELLVALGKIDDEQVKNTIIGYIMNLKRENRGGKKE